MDAYIFCRETERLLSYLNGERYAQAFCQHRMYFQREYLRGIVCSTVLGADFFRFTARALEGLENERLYQKRDGEFNQDYGLAYRKWIEAERKKYEQKI